MADLSADLDLDIQRALQQVNRLEQATSRAVKIDPKGFDGAGREVQKVTRRVRDLEGELDKTDRKAKGVGSTLKGLAAAFSAAAVARGLRAIVDVASDLEESTSKAATVFGDSFAQVEEFADGAATSVGLAKDQALEAAGTFGNFFTAAGLARDAAADLSTGVVTLAADLASFNNLELNESLEKLRAGLAGETEPLRSLGVNITAAAVGAKALELGLAGANGEIDDAAKLQARYALILEQTTNSQGDFLRTSDGLANQQRILSAEVRNVAADLGRELLPTALELVTVARDRLVPAVERVGPALARIAAAGGNTALSLLETLLPVVEALAPVLDLTATALGAIPAPLLAGAGAAFAFNRHITASEGLLSRLPASARNAGTAFLLLAPIVGTLGNALADLAGAKFPDLSGLADELELVARTGKVISGAALDDVGGLSGVIDALDVIADPSAFDNTAAFLNRGLDLVGEVITIGTLDVDVKVERFQKTLAGFDDALTQLAQTDPGIAASLFDQIATAAENSGIPIEAVTRAFPSYTRAVELAAARSDDAADSIEDMGDAAGDAAGEVDELLGALDDLIGTQIGLDDAVAKFQDSLDDLHESLHDAREDGFKKTTDVLDETDDAAREVAGSFREAAGDIINVARKMAEAGATSGELETRIGALIGQLKEQARQFGLTEEQVQQLIDRYNLVPDRIDTLIRTTFTTEGTPPGQFPSTRDITGGGVQAAHGMVVEPRPGGTLVTVAEAGSREVILPTDNRLRARQLLQSAGLSDLIALQVLALGGGAQPLVGSLTVMEAPGFGRTSAIRTVRKLDERVFLGGGPWSGEPL